jgi:hydroxyacylglutathione hydrolase
MFGQLFDKGPDPREITNDEAAKVYDKKDAVFVDVRELAEWDSGHLPGATHIPLGDLPRRASELPVGRRIITVCRSGYRSLDAVNILQSQGHGNVKSMAGGIVEWARQGRAVE